MGKKQSKQAASVVAAAPQLPAEYVLILKSDTCPACRGLTSLINQYVPQYTNAQGEYVGMPIVYQSVSQALQNPTWAPLVQRAYYASAPKGKEPQVGAIPMLMRIRNGRLANVRLGNFNDVAGLKTFLA